MKRFIVDCGRVRTFGDFVTAMNIGFIGPIGGEWNGNLDALNDYLWWPPDLPYELEFVDHAQCARALDHSAMAEWLKRKLVTCHPTNVQQVQIDLAIAESGEGKSLFELIRSVVVDGSQVRLILN